MSYSCAKGASNNDINICIVTQTVSPSDMHKSKIYFHQIKDITNSITKYRATTFVDRTFINAIFMSNNNQLHLLGAICMKLINF